MYRLFNFFIYFFALILLCYAAPTIADKYETETAVALPFQPPESIRELEEQIISGDAVMFEEGFNHCNMDALQTILLDDVVLVHDQAGVDEGKKRFIDRLKTNICNGSSGKPLRTLDPGTTRIFPLYDNGRLYGALQYGQHSFFIKEGDNNPYLTNRARFLTMWDITPNGWKIKRAYSFDHLNPMENHPMDADVLDGGFDQFSTIEFMHKAHNIQAQSLAIIRNGVVTEVRNFGLQDDRNPTSIDTLFNVASLAKPVTALTVLKLVEQGVWEIDAPLAEYDLEQALATFPEARLVTTRHILTHSSGLPNWRYLMPHGKLSFLTKPGTQFEYSGEGFEWLRRAVEAKTGRKLDDLAHEFVFKPAGMTSTSYLYPEIETHRLADRFDQDGQKHKVVPHQSANAAANLITTAEDYGRFLAYVAKGGGLTSPLAGQMISPQIAQTDKIDFGLGWSILKLPDSPAIQHSGSDPGVRSLALIWPDSGDGVVILSNSDGAIPTWQLILTELYGKKGWDVLAANGR